jgi:hypothetical protein
MNIEKNNSGYHFQACPIWQGGPGPFNFFIFVKNNRRDIKLY